MSALPPLWRARRMAHQAFDQLWRRGIYRSRNAAYAQLRRWLEVYRGRPVAPDAAHIAQMAPAECVALAKWAAKRLAQRRRRRRR